jgi:putative ABC transport system ATP-binding protein
MSWWKRRAAEPIPRDTQMPLVRLEGISREFEGDADVPTIALMDVTLDIERGEFVSVSGPSGCGKSTLLSVLAMLDTPSAGRYWFNGRQADRLTMPERARIRNTDIGLIFQSFNLIADLTVFENVEYPLTLRGLSREERKARVMTALERVGIAERASRLPQQLSGGHQQLVAVARAIVGQPPLVLADEPTGNLDSASGETVMAMLQELHAAGSTLCLATHDPRYIALAPRHVYLFDGRLADGPERDSSGRQP